MFQGEDQQETVFGIFGGVKVKYLILCSLFLLNTEIISLLALLMMTAAFIGDIIAERIS